MGGRSAVQACVQYDWQRLIFPVRSRITSDGIRSYEPRVAPRHANVTVDQKSHQMKPTEYLIAYCNGMVAIGMIKHKDQIGDQVCLLVVEN